MTNRESISPVQFCLLMIPIVLGTAILSTPGTAARFANEDAWISVLMSGCMGVWSLSIMVVLAKRYPGLTPVQYAQKIVGKWIGKIIGWYYAYQLLWYASTVSDEIMSFITLYAEPRTPRLVTLFLFVGVCTLVVWAGIEAIGRCAEVIVPLNIIFVILTSILLIGIMQFDYLKPFLGQGLFPIVRGAIGPSAWMGEFFMAGFLLPYLDKPSKGRKAGMAALAVVVGFLTFITLQSLTVNGALTGKMNYAFYAATRYVSIGDFLERIDPIIISVWVFGGFIKNALFLWAFCITVTQLLGYTNHRILVLPLALLMLVGSFWFYSNAFDMERVLQYTFPLMGFVTQNVIPTLLLAIDMVRPRRRGALL